MLFDLKELIKKHNLRINGVIQVGAHYLEEWASFRELGIGHKVFFEADPSNIEEGMRRNGVNDNVWIESVGCGNFNGEIEINIETRNQGQSNTILEPAQCLLDYPDIVYNSKKKIKIIKLDDYWNNIQPMNLLMIDVEGYELEVLKGAVGHLSHIDYILTEVSCEERYKGQAMVDFDKSIYPNNENLDEWLAKYNFKRVDTSWAGVNWGDGLYIKEKPVPKIEIPQMFKPVKGTKKTKIDKTYYINRKSRTDRMENMTQRLSEVGLKAKRFIALEAGDILEGVSEEGSNLTDGMKGCFKSHVSIWKSILDDHKQNNVLILEDDALFADNFNEVLDIALSELPEDYDILYFGASEDNGQYRLKTDDFQVVCPADHQWCTHAYMVNKKVLPKLIEKASTMYAAIDQVLVDVQQTTQTYATMPYIVSQDITKSDLR